MKRISGPLWVFGFALIALAWPFVSNLEPSDIWKPKPVPVEAIPTPAPSPSMDPRVERVINFCMDSRHADSVLCTTDNPNSVDDLESVINQDPGTRYLQTRSPRSKESSENTTRIIEKSDNTRVEQPTTREPPADDNDDGEALIDMPEIPEIDVPEVEVPEMDLPVVGNTGDWTDVVTADSDE